jgi:hypothetical protein
MSNIDGAQIAIWAFWLFFAGLVIYIRRGTNARLSARVAAGPA